MSIYGLGLITKRGLTNRALLLVFLYAANEGKIAISSELLDSLVWLIQTGEVLPFYYQFHYNPSDQKPSSESLSRDLNLCAIHQAVDRTQFIQITPKGKDWVEKEGKKRVEQFEDVLKIIIETLRFFTGMTELQISQAIKTRIEKKSVLRGGPPWIPP